MVGSPQDELRLVWACCQATDLRGLGSGVDFIDMTICSFLGRFLGRFASSFLGGCLGTLFCSFLDKFLGHLLGRWLL